MRRALIVVLAGAAAGTAGARDATAQSTEGVSVIPRPARLDRHPGALTLGGGARVAFVPPDDAEVRAAAAFWLDDVRTLTGLRLPEDAAGRATPDAPRLEFRIDPALPTGAEGYRLTIEPSGLVLEAAAAAGIFYGAQTLRQLSPPAIEAPDAPMSERPVSLPALRIEDAPRFAYRGMHLDVVRHMFPVAFIERYIDLMSRFKLNTFHWHLTDDQGWRIRIDGYPRLTDVGAWRRETVVGKNFDPFIGDGVRYGGFYTKEDIRRVVSYAAARHVTVIPEIEMPGHSLAALAAYPELACTGGPFEVGTRWGVYEDIYCPSERTFAFLEGVLTEVMDLFPSRYVHIGGDEAPKARWRESDVARRVMREEGLADEEALQSWFMSRIERFLAAHGRRPIGWDEILEGGLTPDATVMSWRGTAGGIEATRQGHDVVMTPGSHLYFDHYQGRDRTREPLAIGGFTPLEKVYAFEPVPDDLDPTAARHVLGAQANLWTEYIATPEQVEYMAYPRALALAEVVWAPRDARDWDDFVRRLPGALAHLERAGVGYRIPTVRGLGGERLTLANRATVRLSSPLPSATLRYTLDGTDPTSSAQVYEAPFDVALDSGPVEVRARAFVPGGRASPVTTGRFAKAEPLAAVDAGSDRPSPGLRLEVASGQFASVDELASAGLATRGRVPEPVSVDTFPEEAFGLRLTGYVDVPDTGVYAFHLTSDDGSRLSIGGRTVVDHDGPHAATERSGQVALEAGRHRFELLYFEAGGGEALALEVTPPGGSRGPIPRSWWWSSAAPAGGATGSGPPPR